VRHSPDLARPARSVSWRIDPDQSPGAQFANLRWLLLITARWPTVRGAGAWARPYPRYNARWPGLVSMSLFSDYAPSTSGLQLVRNGGGSYRGGSGFHCDTMHSGPDGTLIQVRSTGCSEPADVRIVAMIGTIKGALAHDHRRQKRLGRETLCATYEPRPWRRDRPHGSHCGGLHRSLADRGWLALAIVTLADRLFAVL
jgi:hypothetical protein